MKELNFDLGVETYVINGKCEISFNPTDSGFLEKLINLFDALDALQDKYYEQTSKKLSYKEHYELAKQTDREMRAIIDDAFPEPICDKVFGDLNVFAFADGLYLWANLLFALIDEIASKVENLEPQANARIAKYTAKYKKK